jgi:endonuclease G, mitochondrial
MKLETLVLIALCSFSLFSQEYLPKSGGEIVKHKYYTLSYNEAHEQANWVHYKLNPAFLSGSTPRTDSFKSDPLVSTESATKSDYKGSGYDRGHLAPAADMKYNSLAMLESFYMSNMSPQNPSFNRGIWKRLESLVRGWGEKFEIYVSTAGVLGSNNIGAIGKNRVTIPSKYYKVIYAPNKNIMIGFLLSNAKQSGSLYSYTVSVDKIESLTGIDFFSELPDNIEEELESKVVLENWDFTASSSGGYSSSSYSNSVSVQCNGVAKSTGNRCRNKTTKTNGYCYLHQNQSSSYVKPKPTKANYVGRCNATTKAGSRCKRNASAGSRYCWQHK